MSDQNPLGRFTERAELYARFRPDYPAAAIDHILRRCGWGAGSALVDVGSGTGISSRLFAQRGLQVYGIEPNDEMRARAESATVDDAGPAPKYLAGQAEATGLPDGFADGIVSAQAFHWFDAERALAEFQRILKLNGWVALMSYERDESDPFTAAYGAALRAAPNAVAIETQRADAGKALLESSRFMDAERMVFKHSQSLNEDGVLGRVFSTSYAPREPVPAEALIKALRTAFGQYQRDGAIVMCYDTIVYVGRRA